MVLLFREWLTLSEGDEGLRAFIDSQNRSFKDFLQKLLEARKITDPRLVQEAETLIADKTNQLFDYGQELLKMASAGRGRLGGADVLQGATEAAGRIWQLLWRPEAYAGTQTWETRFPLSAHRGGIRGTVRAVANNLIGHFAQRLRKTRAGASTFQQSQIEKPIEPEARATNQEGEWEEWRSAIVWELVNDLHDEMADDRGGKHQQSRIRNLRWAIAIAGKQMAVPYQWRSMPEVMAEIPELQGVARGGLQQALKALIDDARNRVVATMGSDKEQAVAQWLQSRGRRTWGRTRTDERFLPFAPSSHFLAEPSPAPAGSTFAGFGEYVAAQEALLSPARPVRACAEPVPGDAEATPKAVPTCASLANCRPEGADDPEGACVAPASVESLFGGESAARPKGG